MVTSSANHIGHGNRVDGIDLLRGLAIFYVVMNHVNIRLHGAHVPYSEGIPKEVMIALVWKGQDGVQMFFAISGFLITSISLRRWGSLARIKLYDFYKLRFARIAPLLLLLLFVLSILHYAGFPHYVIPKERSSLPRALLSALTFHLNWLEAHRDIYLQIGTFSGPFRLKKCFISFSQLCACSSAAKKDSLHYW